MSAPKKLSDAAVLGAISAHEAPARSGPTQQELAVMLGVSVAGIQAYLKTLLRSGGRLAVLGGFRQWH